MHEKDLSKEKSVPGSCFFLVEENQPFGMHLLALLSLHPATTEATQRLGPLFPWWTTNDKGFRGTTLWPAISTKHSGNNYICGVIFPFPIQTRHVTSSMEELLSNHSLLYLTWYRPSGAANGTEANHEQEVRSEAWSKVELA